MKARWFFTASAVIFMIGIILLSSYTNSFLRTHAPALSSGTFQYQAFWICFVLCIIAAITGFALCFRKAPEPGRKDG